MRAIRYEDYLDRVWGCWLGKCVAGTIGGPYEGMKQLMDVKFNPSMIENMAPNDDLDLQVLWLDVLEKKGESVSSDDLAEAFAWRCPYGPGEYAYFKKNFKRGIHPPVSGAFNNRYYIEGMGCPIRSEIWACVVPGNPVLAADYAAKDGVMDHAGESIFAEQFLAALEAEAFFTRDLKTLYEIGLQSVPENSKVRELVAKVLRWCELEKDWRQVRARILRDYGHPDCTNMFQNIGITLLALHYGEGDFIETSMIALNCGFDTDCSCATAGALLGILHGGRRLCEQYGFSDQRFVLGVDAPRRTDLLHDLALDTCRMGIHFAETVNKEIRIEDSPRCEPLNLDSPSPVRFSVDYSGIPVLAPGETRRIGIRVENCGREPLYGPLLIYGPEDWIVKPQWQDKIAVPGRGNAGVKLIVSIPTSVDVLSEKNSFRILFKTGSGAFDYTFGIAGAALWQVFGPFWENIVEVPPLKPGESYYAHLGGGISAEDDADRTRTYHLNTRANLDKEYISLAQLTGESPMPKGADYEPRLVSLYEDRFSMSDLVGFQGPCVVYLVRRLVSPEDRIAMLLIGHTGPFKLWLNGVLVAQKDTVDWWTAENVHVPDVKINKGENVVIMRLARLSDRADFSLCFGTKGICSDHYYDFASANTQSL